MDDAHSLKLPLLRRDLRFFAGPAAPDGTPTFTIYDPVSGRYSKIGWVEATVLRHLRPGTTLGNLLEKLNRLTTLRLTAKEIISFCEAAAQNNLIAGTSQEKGQRLIKLSQARQKNLLQWLLAHYLFIRIPLLHPAAFLRRTVAEVKLLASTGAFWAYALTGFMGVCLVARRSDEYFNTFTYFFNWRGLAAYAAAIVVLKCIHEFAHAYTASNFGVHVRTMGIAFIVFWPMPFCDVTDAWKLSRRRQRFLIAFAGIAAELVIAGCSLFFWALAPAGVLKSIFFVLSSITVVSTLLMNLNPAMRFDGYYLMMDLSGVDNLQRRAFAVTRWNLRAWLLGLQLPPPESDLPAKRQAWMMAYSIYTWIYRFFLYLGIAVLVYYKFTKFIGIILFLAEIWVFIAQPLIREGKELMLLRKFMTINRRLVLTLVVILLFLVWFCQPTPRSLSLSAVVLPEESQTIYVPAAGVVEELAVGRGDRVKAGQRLLRVFSAKLATEMEVLETEREILEVEINMLATDEKRQAFLQQRREELAKTKAKLKSLRGTAAKGEIRAQLSGTIYAWDQSLAEGQAVSGRAVLGRIAALDRLKVVSYLGEDFIGAVQVGDRVEFVTSGTMRTVTGKIRSISPVRAKVIEHPVLTSMAKGDIAVTPDRQGRLLPRRSYYKMEIALSPRGQGLSLGQGGFLKLKTKPRSRLVDAARYLWGIVLQESGF